MSSALPVLITGAYQYQFRLSTRRKGTPCRSDVAADLKGCPDCGGQLRVIASVEEPALIRRILAHVRAREEPDGVAARAPPEAWPRKSELF